jgi:uncharacterized membrane protein
MSESTLQDLIEQDRPKNRRERLLKTTALVGPLFVAVTVPTVILLLFGFAAMRRFLANSALASLFLGKFIIVRGIGGSGYSAWDYALLVLYLDMLVAFFLTYNLDYAYRIPYLGRRLEGLQDHGRDVVAERPWVRKVTFFGVILFVMFPLTGTGAVGGSIFGRLLGLSRIRTLTGIFVGSVAGCLGMALLADAAARVLPDQVRKSVWFELIGLSVLLLLAFFLWLRSRKVERVRRERKEAAGRGENGKGGV